MDSLQIIKVKNANIFKKIEDNQKNVCHTYYFMAICNLVSDILIQKTIYCSTYT